MASERLQRRIDRLLDQIDSAESSGDWKSMRELALDVLKVAPENREAAAYLDSATRRLEAPGQAAGNGGSTSSGPAMVPTQSAHGSPTSVQPSSFASGRYTVKCFLGEGGKKKVYLAHDNTLDRDVAFALIKTEGLDEVGRERVRREAQAMGRMGTHPAIMPIYDLGDEVGQPHMVQPLMGGGDVEGLIEKAKGPLELGRAIEIAQQVCRGLSFAHGKGIVHRDLKPGNVWLDEDGSVKIGDFGLAVATDRSRLTVEKVMVGTVNYMPPEQAVGGELTPRADLYSLGAMLYEMCTGRVPFMGDDDIAVIGQHVNTPPVAPSWHNPKIPRTLDSLILRLLAKDPVERPASADEVNEALAAVDLTAVEQPDAGKEGSLDSMAGGVFVGRQREMDTLKAKFEEVLSGKGRMVTLVGEPGIGKTRTAQELATYAGMRGAEVLWGRSYESGGAPPYWPWVQAIRSHVAATDPQTLRNQLGSAGSVVAEVIVDIKERLSDLPAATKIEDPESARFRLFDSISTFLKNISRTQPLVLMLEDLHWADKPSLLLLEFFVRELVNSKVLVVGNYRDVELNRRHPLAMTLGDLTRERLFERVVLRGLQRHDVQRFIEIAAGIDPPVALVDTVYAQTEGNPLFVTETVRLLIQEGDISAGHAAKGGTTSWEIRIPEGVREVIGRRLNRLSERCNEVLTIAAVIGRQFRFGVLRMLIEDSTEGQLLDAMDEALAARIIEELPDEVGLYQFTHASMQETLTDELSANRRVRMHARIAEALEAYYGDRAEENAAELVEHFTEAETVLGTGRLVKYGLAAGERALGSYAFEEAERQLTRILSHHTRRDELAARANLGLATALMNTSERARMQRAGDALVAAYGLSEEIGVQHEMTVSVLRRFPLVNVQGISGITNLYQRAIGSTEKGSPEHLDLLLGVANWAYYELYDGGMALAAANEALEVATALDDDLRKLRALLLLYAVQQLDRYTPNLDFVGQVEPLVARIDDAHASLQAYQYLGNELTKAGELEKAQHWHESAIATARTNHNRWVTATATGDLMQVLVIGGHLSQVIEIAEESADELGHEVRFLTPAYYAYALTGDLANAKRITGLFDSAFPRGTRFSTMWGAWPSVITSWLLGIDTVDRSRLRDMKELLDSDRPVWTGFRDVAVAIWGLAAVMQGDRATAEESHSLQSSSEARAPGGIPSGSWLLVSAPGVIAEYLGNYDEAARGYEYAADIATRFKSPTLTAIVLTDYAGMLLKRDGPGDRNKALELQDEAIGIARELGMKPLLERVLNRRKIMKA